MRVHKANKLISVFRWMKIKFPINNEAEFHYVNFYLDFTYSTTCNYISTKYNQK